MNFFIGGGRQTWLKYWVIKMDAGLLDAKLISGWSQFDIYRDDMLLVDHWLVKSQQSDVILEGGRVVGLVHGLAADLVVLVGKLLALVPHIPLTQANLKSHTGLF